MRGVPQQKIYSGFFIILWNLFFFFSFSRSAVGLLLESGFSVYFLGESLSTEKEKTLSPKMESDCTSG